METTNNKLTSYQNVFFNKLSNFLDTKLYFFGSVQRFDYFPNSSDIDVTIFTENKNSTIIKLLHFLGMDRSNVREVVWNINHNTLIKGNKLKYKDIDHNLYIEFSIYNEKYKEIVLNDHNSKKTLPFYATFLLLILKFFYYKMKLISKDVYIKSKRFILNTLVVTKRESQFVMV